MKLEEFKKKNRPKKKSILFPFKSQILELYKCNYSLKSIQIFLKENGVKTSCVNIHKFIKKELEEQEPKKRTLNYTKEPKPKQQEEKESWGVKFTKNNLIKKALEGDLK